MICRRRLHRLRSSKTLTVLVVTTVFLAVFFTYKTLNSHDATASSHVASLPSLEKKKPRYKAAHHQQNLFGDRAQLRTNLHLQVNSGLKVAAVKEVMSLLYPANWRSAREADEVAIILKDRMIGLNLDSAMSCRDINEYQISGSLGHSGKKFVEKLEEPDSGDDGYNMAEHNRKKRKLLAIKSQASDVQTKIACMKQVYNADFCGPMGNYLLMREIFLLRFFKHPNLISLLGYCLRGDQISMDIRKKGLVMVMEFGIPLMLHTLESLSWSHRVQLALDTASVLEYLVSSPLGSVALPHVQLKDFVMVNHKSLKLTDLDEAELGERKCTQNRDCLLQGADVGVLCHLGHCDGLNQRINLRTVGSSVLEPLLRQMPPEERSTVGGMLERIRKLDVPPSELVNFLEAMKEKYPITEVLHEDVDGYHHIRDKAHKRLDKEDDDDDDDDDEEEDRRDGWTGKKKQSGHGRAQHTLRQNPQPAKYKRLDGSNFPGQYDYLCADSRVLWGCVMTFHTLEAAMDQCTSDIECKSFVVFASQPESEGKMTVVFKDSHNENPQVNLGTTLFVKTSDQNGDQDQPVAKEDEDDNRIHRHGQDAVEAVDSVPRDTSLYVQMQECLNRIQENQNDALRSREKRLMAHVGLKGKREGEWKRTVRMQSVASYTNLRPLPGQGSHGGSVIVVFNTSSPANAVARATFMVEESSTQNHVAFALVYSLDRLLGLYHTPPMVAGYIPSSFMEQFSADKTWRSVFNMFRQDDGTVQGLYVAPTPKVVKRTELVLAPLNEMVTKITPFDRVQKMHLEYVLLWWLGHVAKPSNLHRGFKGHLLHIDGDQAFQEPAINYAGYFNHCQFPNLVYKLLSCFRCHQGQTRVCSLGQEAVRLLELTGFKLSSLHIQSLRTEDYPALINGAASRTVEIVDKCIKDFGREAVLY